MDPVELFLERWILRAGTALLWGIALLICAPAVPAFVAYRYRRDRRSGRRGQPWLAFMTKPGRVAFLVLALLGSEAVALAWFASEYLGGEAHIPSVLAPWIILLLLLILAVDAAARILMAGASIAAARLR